MKTLITALVLTLPVIAEAADIPKGGVKLISKSAPGQGVNAHCSEPAISGNGKKLAVTTVASNLGSGTYNGFNQVLGFRRDSGVIGSFSVMAGGQLGNADSTASALSKSGRYVAFQNTSALGLPIIPNGATRVYWHDRTTGELRHVSIGPNGAMPAANAFIRGLSDNGRFVLFSTLADNLITGNSAMLFRGYVHDVELGTTELVTVTNNGTALDTNVFDMDISGDGRFVFFASDSTLHGFGSKAQVYVRDRVLGTTALLSKSGGGAPGNGDSSLCDVSVNGRYVVIETEATNLVPTLSEAGLVRLDLETGKFRALVVSVPGKSISFVARQCAISNDGRRLIIANGYMDNGTGVPSFAIHEHDIEANKRWLVAEELGVTSVGSALYFAASATCEWVNFVTKKDLLEENGVNDAYLYRAH